MITPTAIFSALPTRGDALDLHSGKPRNCDRSVNPSTLLGTCCGSHAIIRVGWSGSGARAAGKPFLRVRIVPLKFLQTGTRRFADVDCLFLRIKPDARSL